MIKPCGGRSYDDIRSGYYKYRVGRYLFFYYQFSEGVEIIPILYDRMNIEAYFDDEK
jgi:toxin ParE1/3/4